MKEKLLFEIHIYSMPKNVFDNKWKKFKQREVEIFLKTNDELDEYEYWINKIYFPISV